jgi:hypothetical protein
MMHVELLHEANEIFDCFLHLPLDFLVFTSDKAVPCSNLDIENEKIGEAIPRLWIVVKCGDTSGCRILLELVRSHLAEEVSTS